MRRMGVTIAAALLLAGCAEVDRPQLSELEPIGDDAFRFNAMENIAYTESDFMGWLQAWLQQNQMCPNGYEITSHKRVLVATELFHDYYRHFYEGRCKAS